MHTPLATFAVLIVSAALSACGGESPKKPSAETQAPAQQASTQAGSGDASTSSGGTSAAAGASGKAESSGKTTGKPAAATSAADQEGPHVTFSGSGGRAHWVGTAPPLLTLTIDAAKSEGCHEHAPMDMLDRSVLVDLEGGLANVVIEVEVAGMQAAVAEEPYVMDQAGCRYEPHVLVVPAGAVVEYRNSDSVGHNVHTYARRNDSMNKTVAAKGAETQRYSERDQIEVKCDIHPWMSAWVVVSGASVFALSAADGSFALPGLPPGEHKLSCWHEQLGKASGRLTVGEDGAIAELDLQLTRRR